MADERDDAGDGSSSGGGLDDVPFERAFPPAGGAELTKSYIPALERLIEEKKQKRGKKS